MFERRKKNSLKCLTERMRDWICRFVSVCMYLRDRHLYCFTNTFHKMISKHLNIYTLYIIMNSCTASFNHVSQMDFVFFLYINGVKYKNRCSNRCTSNSSAARPKVQMIIFHVQRTNECGNRFWHFEFG